MANPCRRGYPQLAALTAGLPEYEGYVFRRFDRLSARNLQHLESELASLEARLDDEDQAASEIQDVDTERALYNWERFKERAETPQSIESGRMDLYREISSKLKDYYEMLTLQAQVAAMEQPQKSQLTMVRKRFNMGTHPSHFRQGDKRHLGGRDYSRLDHAEELVTSKRSSEQDLLSRFLRKHPGFLKSERLPHGEEHFNEKHIELAIAAVSVTLAAILLLGAIITLRFVRKENTRIGVIVGFTILFAGTVGLMTNAKRAEVFASSAAYAAVLVVFVSGELGGSEHRVCQCMIGDGNSSSLVL